MAEKNQLRVAAPVDLADDDPFAELTRIMGFDPRQPAKQPAPAPVSAPAPAQPRSAEQAGTEPAAEDDFGLDLEKELLGDFDLEDVLASEFAAPAVDQATDIDFSSAFEEAMGSSEFSRPAHKEEERSLADDLDAVFLATAAQDEPADAGDMLDQGLSDTDLFRLDEAATSPASLPAAPEIHSGEAADDVSGIDADLDAAMADFDFLSETQAMQPVAAESAYEAEPAYDDAPLAGSEIAQPQDIDFAAFDDADFNLDEEPASAPIEPSFGDSGPVAQFSEEPLPEIDENDFSFGVDDLRFDEAPPAGEAIAAQTPEPADFPFDDVDFGTFEHVAEAGDLDEPPVQRDALAGQEVHEPAAGEAWAENGRPGNEQAVDAQPAAMDSVAETPSSQSAQPFEFSVPAYVPRKLPISPMDVAAEEFRQREAATPEPEPEFNLEDELNALLGNAKPDRQQQAPAEEDVPASPVEAVDAYDQAPAYQPSYATADEPAYGGTERVDLDTAEIDEAFSWDLEAALADEAEQDIPVDPYTEDDQPGIYPDSQQTLDPAIAGAAFGSAAGQFSSYRSATAEQSYSPHRDPVVRGNPLKEDPLDVITQLTEKYSRKEPLTSFGHTVNVAAGTGSTAYQQPLDNSPEDHDAADAFAFEQPEVETIEVIDHPVALADDLDIPDLPAEEELPSVSAYDDLDAEFPGLLTGMEANQPVAGHEDPMTSPMTGGFSARPYESSMAATPHGARPVSSQPQTHQDDQAYQHDFDPNLFALDADDLAGSRAAGQAGDVVDDFQFDSDFDQGIASSRPVAESRQKLKSRGLLIAGLVGGVALIGALGAFALSFGGGEDTPVVVRADGDPVKVRPENPGGATVPNQDSKVYETVAGEGADGPRQEKLVTTTEEPLDVTSPGDDVASASGKNEDRIEQILQDAEGQTDAEIIAVAPRKVRTMIVKPDGTLVPREDEPANVSDEQTEAIAAATASSETPETTGTLPAPEDTQTAAVPAASTDQQVADEVNSEQVAAVTAPADGWAMQIASQPSEAAARSTYQDLARRYSSVLQGRDVMIVKAEIAGKGTFWRVRMPAESRSEAINLCETYKAAGGNCFVSK